MRRVLRGMLVLSLASAAWAPAAPGAGTGGGVPIRITPSTGGTHTKFVVRFAIPNTTGTTNASQTTDYITVQGRGVGCINEYESQDLRSAKANTAFRVVLDPSWSHERWCVGRYAGALMESQTNVCRGRLPAAIMCPQLMLAPRVLGRFDFTVRASPAKTGR